MAARVVEGEEGLLIREEGLLIQGERGGERRRGKEAG